MAKTELWSKRFILKKTKKMTKNTITTVDTQTRIDREDRSWWCVKRTGSDRSVGPVQLGTGPQASPIFIIKSGAVKTGKNCEPDRSNRLTDFFFLILVKISIVSFIKKKKEEEAQSEQKFISFRILILLVCLFAIYS